MAEDHARWAPSSASRWISCPGSVLLTETGSVPRRDGKAAEFGTICHEAAAKWITTGEPPQGASQEVIDAIGGYVSSCQDVIGSPGVDRALVECRVELSPDIWGTVDFWAYDGEILYVCDLKTGMGHVNEVDNWQLIIYALAICRTFAITPKEYVLSIFQRELRLWSPSTEYMAAAEYLLGRPREEWTKAGPHCRYCPARHRCHSLWVSASQLAEAAMEPTSEEPDAEEIGWKLSEIERAMERLSALDSGLRTFCESADITPKGWAWEKAWGNRQWKVPPEYLKEISPKLVEMVALSPAKAAKIISQDIVDSISFRPDNGRKLKKEKNG